MSLSFCGNPGKGLGAQTQLLGSSNGRKLLGSKVVGIYLKLSLEKNFFPKPLLSLKNLKK